MLTLSWPTAYELVTSLTIAPIRTDGIVIGELQIRTMMLAEIVNTLLMFTNVRNAWDQQI